LQKKEKYATIQNKDNMIKLLNNKQLTIDEQHGLDGYKEQLLLFS